VPPENDVVLQRHTEIDLDIDRLQYLFAASWEDGEKAWLQQVLEHSFTWITAHAGDEIVGYANVAWDGGVHFFLLDPTVLPAWRHRGIGTLLVKEAIAACREYGKGDHLHVDSSEELMRDFYFPAGFHPTHAGTVWVGPTSGGGAPGR
jgi:GNAT superfamily N-acetyltransferase